jgi:hypothetical protein
MALVDGIPLLLIRGARRAVCRDDISRDTEYEVCR